MLEAQLGAQPKYVCKQLRAKVATAEADSQHGLSPAG